jgi:fructose-specific component phosphotransferase system IIB-like protein
MSNEEADQLAQSFMKRYDELEPHTGGAFIDVMWVFLEAVGCYKNNLFLGSAVLCRTAIDAALYSAIAYTPNPHGQPTIDESMLASLLRTRIRWEKLKDYGRNHLHLDEDLLNTIEKTRDLGNFAAHFAERVLKAKANQAAGKTADGPAEDERIVVTPGEAYESLAKVSQFITTVMAKWKDSATNKTKQEITRSIHEDM